MDKEKEKCLYITLDIGGTNWRMAVFEGETIKSHKSGEWEANLGPEAGVKRFREIISSDLEANTKVGVAFPGLIGSDGIVHAPPNLPKWDGFNLKDALQKELGAPVCVANDATMYALGEWKYGAARGYSDVIVVTLGTGIGGGIISGGRLILGSEGFAGEIGHIFIAGRDSKRCGCGNWGCLEAFIGAKAFMEEVRRRFLKKKQNPPEHLEELARLAEQGDSLANEMWEIYGSRLGRGLAAASNLLDPECIVLGGGVSRAWNYFYSPFLESLRENIMGGDLSCLLYTSPSPRD